MTSSTMKRLLIYYWYNVRWSRLLILLVVIGVAGILYGPQLFGSQSRPNYVKSKYGAARYKVENEPEKMDAEAVRRTLEALVDTRPPRCRDHAYEFTRLESTDTTTSIILSYHNAEFYSMKLALSAIVEHTPYDLYEEIVVLDDGTTDDHIRREVTTFLRNPQFNKVKSYRSESRDGQSASWFKAAAATTSQLLIFIDASVVVNHGWLQPLLAKLIDNDNVIVVPHVDNILDDDRFFRTDDWLVNVLTWTLTTVYYETPLRSDKYDTLDTPVARGDVLATGRKFLDSIGGFDDKMRPDDGAGTLSELSLRAWMCGGAVRIATCSRVAVRNSLRARRIADPVNFRRVAELWLEDFRGTAYRQGSVSEEMSSSEKQSVTDRRTFMSRTVPNGCKSFSWYLNNIATAVLAPSENMRQFGKLRAKTMYCVRAAQSGDVDMTLCRQFMYEPATLFELTADGAVFRGDRCLEASEDGRQVRWRPCDEGSRRQRWNLDEDGRLTINVQPGSCLAHVSKRDPATMDLFHFPELHPCSHREEDIRRQTWMFVE